MTKQPMLIDTTERQKSYIEEQRRKGDGLGVVFADAFLRGMRDLGYKSPAWALSEMIDNSFQAGATTCAIGFGFDHDNKSQAKPDQVAIVDDGNGMIPDMISYAVRWGGTDREGDRTGFGRYGYGLPSSAVSMAKRYTVYSKAPGLGWHAVTVDIEELAKASGDLTTTETLLRAIPRDPPTWVGNACGDLDPAEMESGTVVVLEDLDRLRSLRGWITRKALSAKLLTHMGVVYRHWLPGHRILVDAEEAQPVDPLFLMEHGRFFNETDVRAERVEARSFEVRTDDGRTGTVTLRASVLPPTFQLAEPGEYGVKDARSTRKNARHKIMKEYNGILICRERRQIDCIAPPWMSFQNYDRNIKVEIDFDPQLDEFFGITTSKQQITLDESMWDKLRSDGKAGGDLVRLIRDLRSRFKEIQDRLAADAQHRSADDGVPRPSIDALDSTSHLKDSPPSPSPKQQDDATRNLEAEARRRARDTGRPEDEAKAEVLEETAAGGWRVRFDVIPEGPVYRPHRVGELKEVIVNTEHPFYTRAYAKAPEIGSALEVLMLVLSERELESSDTIEAFYKSERSRWSDRLRHALTELVSDLTMANIASAIAEGSASPEAPEG